MHRFAGATIHARGRAKLFAGLADNRDHFRIETSGLQHIDADVVMQPHQGRFIGAESSRLVQDGIGHADFPDVVQ